MILNLLKFYFCRHYFFWYIVYIVTKKFNAPEINDKMRTISRVVTFQETNDFISALNKEILDTHEIKSVIANLQIKENSSKGPSLNKIQNLYKKNPKNLDKALILSEKYFVNQMIENAFELLLELYKNHKDKDRDKIKKTLIKYFEALGNSNEHTKHYRKKFSSIMFV